MPNRRFVEIPLQQARSLEIHQGHTNEAFADYDSETWQEGLPESRISYMNLIWYVNGFLSDMSIEGKQL